MRTTEPTRPTPHRRPSSRALGGVLGVFALVGLALGTIQGCGLSAGLTTDFTNDGGTPPEDIPTGSVPVFADATAADAAAKVPYRGSPLCHATKDSCWPDDGASQCGGSPPPAADAGTSKDGAPPAYGDSCRVTLSGPTCTSAGATKDGATCTTASDCSAGADCVLRADGMGQCRRYCCGGTCANVGSPSGGATFCDVVQLAEEASVKVPVCMPVKACKLLTTGQCETGETCAVASEDGVTSCVPTGSAQVDEACDETHCATGLTCLGKPGARRCFQLCRVGGACGSNLVCKTSSLIRDTMFGLCQPR